MNVDMIPLEMIGLKTDLQTVLRAIRRLGCVQIDAISETPQVSARPLTLNRELLKEQEEISFLLARVEGLLSTLKKHGCLHNHQPDQARPPVNVEKYQQNIREEAHAIVDEITPQIQALSTRWENLDAEMSTLPRYETTLRTLLPMIPASANEPGYMTIGVLVSRGHIGVLESLGKRILELTNGRAEIVASDVDTATRAMLIVFPGEYTSSVETLLGKEDVSRLRLPAELGEGPPDKMINLIHQRLAAIPKEKKEIQEKLESLADQWCEKLMVLRMILRDEVDANSVLSRFGETDMTFILVGWVSARDLEKLQKTLKAVAGERVLLQPLPLTSEMKKRAPIILQNPAPARPFESLVGLLALPRYGHIDPTLLMAFFLPLFFGMMLGDVGYGLILLAFTLLLMRKFKKGIVHDIVLVLLMGSVWAILFGFLFGEAFGTLGEKLGMHALWFERARVENVQSLMALSLAVGVVHIILGLILGVWEGIKDRSRNHLLERGGMLVGLIGLFVLVGVLAGIVPAGFKTPAIAGLIIGIVLIGASMRWLGILMGPIEFVSLIGNILSYLRIAAIGLASVYLAKVANDMAGMVGSLVAGIIIALLFQSLNLIMGVFSPSIHSLRLHYVEFFRKFYEGGGRPFEPFKAEFKPQGETQWKQD